MYNRGVKRPLIITIGIVTILLIIGVWVYLLMFGAPKQTSDVFTNLGVDVTPRPAVVVEAPTEQAGYTVDTSSGLQQLTTRPVAGYTAITATTSSSTIVRYVEQGTGYIYDIDLETGVEKQISRKTVPKVRSAVFSPNGQTVALTAIDGYRQDTFVGKIDTANETIEGEDLMPNVTNIFLADENTVKYTAESTDGLIGYSYDLTSSQLKQNFVVPFRDIKVIWLSDTTYFYNKPAEHLLGYLYKVEGGSYQPTDIKGYSLTVDASQNIIVYSHDNSTTKFRNLVTNTENDSPIKIIPEKCAFYNKIGQSELWCANPINPNDLNTIEWYQGKSLGLDNLWLISSLGYQATLIVDLEKLSGRPIDVKDIMVSNNDKLLLFNNKLDNTLWKFNI